jgi:hypothetical protein
MDQRGENAIATTLAGTKYVHGHVDGTQLLNIPSVQYIFIQTLTGLSIVFE